MSLVQLHRASVALLACLALGRVASAEDAPRPDEAVVRARVDGILSMYCPEGGLLDNLVSEFLSREGTAAVPYLVSLVETRLAQDKAPATSGGEVPIAVLVGALGQTADARALPVLVKSLRSGTTEQRVAAARALGRYGSGASFEALLHALDQKAFQARSAVAEALVETGRSVRGVDVCQSLVDAARKDKALRAGTMDALAQLGGPVAVEFLREMLHDGEAMNRLRAVQLLPTLAADEAGPWILPLLEDESPNVRKEVCIALGRSKLRDAVPDLIALLSPDTDPGLHASALWALRQIAGTGYADDPALWRRWWNAEASASAER